MYRFLLKLALLNVFKKRVRAFLTIGGVAISVSVMVFMLGLGAGLQNMVTEQISKTALRNVVTVQSKNSKQLGINQEKIARFQSISGVTTVEGVMNVSGQVTYNGISLVMPIYAVTPNYFDLVPLTKVAGETEAQMGSNANNIIISQAAMNAFKSKTNIVGKNLTTIINLNNDTKTDQTEATQQLDRKEFKVTGVVDKGLSPVAYIPVSYLQKQGASNFSEAKIQVTYTEKVPTIRESVEQLGYQTTNVQDAIDQVDRIFKVIRSILIAFGIISVLITVFGTINTITIQLVEETRQIGFLRIMGIKREHVGLLFVMQSVILAFSGVTIGIIGGLFFGSISNGMVQAVAVNGMSDGKTINIYQIPIKPIIIMLVLSIILGWVIGLMPAKRAVKINPLDAIKS